MQKESGMGKIGKVRQNGFTLVQLLICLAVMGILVGIAYPVYDKIVRDARLQSVRAALMENARFMEQHYARHVRYKKNSTQWPDLPVTEAEGFCIRMSGSAKGIHEDKYTLKAVAFDKKKEPRVLKVNEAGTAVLCASSKSSCDEKGEVFSGKSGTDSECRKFGIG